MTQEVLPAGAEDASPNGITVTTRQALTILAIMEDEALAHALVGLAVAPGAGGTTDSQNRRVRD